ncbi:MAG: SBBP repeat-containing protein, partial [Bacteroidia bacterium]|nr:SBBP repeat-containing protein [Bacteroidia bacterium]
DGSGNAYVTGLTQSTDYDVTVGAFQTTHGGGLYDVFVTKLNASGSSLVYSTYIGGSGFDEGYSIAVDGSGSAYVTG